MIYLREVKLYSIDNDEDKARYLREVCGDSAGTSEKRS